MQGTTLVGPHRDDIKFIVNENDVAVFGSQGQQRTTALAVKLAEIDLMQEETGEYPVLLLDDVLSELDANRQTHLLLAIEWCGTTIDSYPESVSRATGWNYVRKARWVISRYIKDLLCLKKTSMM